jgi:hypothetical protein
LGFACGALQGRQEDLIANALRRLVGVAAHISSPLALAIMGGEMLLFGGCVNVNRPGFAGGSLV